MPPLYNRFQLVFHRRDPDLPPTGASSRTSRPSSSTQIDFNMSSLGIKWDRRSKEFISRYFDNYLDKWMRGFSSSWEMRDPQTNCTTYVSARRFVRYFEDSSIIIILLTVGQDYRFVFKIKDNLAKKLALYGTLINPTLSGNFPNSKDPSNLAKNCPSRDQTGKCEKFVRKFMDRISNRRRWGFARRRGRDFHIPHPHPRRF